MSAKELLAKPLSVNEKRIVITSFLLNVPDVLNRPEAEQERFGRNVPGVYCFYDDKTMYIGESMHPFIRLKQHTRPVDAKEAKLSLDKDVLVYISPQFSKSSVFHIEGELIQMADAYVQYLDKNARTLLNANRNYPPRLEGHRYFLKDQYDGLSDRIWGEWLQIGLVNAGTDVLRRTPRFILSPFKNLNSNQSEVLTELLDKWKQHRLIVVKGFPGTGKSVLAATLFYRALEEHKVCLTSGTEPSLKHFVDMFKKDLRGTSSAIKTRLELIKRCHPDSFELVIVDEGHRLLKKANKGHPGKFMHMQDDQNELSLLVDKFKHVVVFYDENQNVHGADFDAAKVLEAWRPYEMELSAQERLAEGAGDYVHRLFAFLGGQMPGGFYDGRYPVWQFDKFSQMHAALKNKVAKEVGRHGALLSGYTRPWKTKSLRPEQARQQQAFDFELDGIRLRWNTHMRNWLEQTETKRLEEVGYYRVVQGMETDYTGVIIGKDLYWDPKAKCLRADERSVENPNERPKKSAANSDLDYQRELLRYVTNRYKVLLTRATQGQFIFVEDEHLRAQFKKLFAVAN